LTSILYDNKKIKIIERLILATVPDYKEPKDILEEIILKMLIWIIYEEKIFLKKIMK